MFVVGWITYFIIDFTVKKIKGVSKDTRGVLEKIKTTRTLKYPIFLLIALLIINAPYLLGNIGNGRIDISQFDLAELVYLFATNAIFLLPVIAVTVVYFTKNIKSSVYRYALWLLVSFFVAGFLFR